jgi:Transcriptional regulator
MTPAPKSSGRKKPRYGAPAVERAVELLQLLAEEPAGCTLAQLCKRSNISKNSVFRILNTLVAADILEKDEDSQKFSIGGKLLGIAFRGTGAGQLTGVALDFMKQLRDQTGETVLLGKVLTDRGVVLEQVSGLHPVKVHVEPGTPFLLHSSAPGKAFLAALPEKERKQRVRHLTLRKQTERTLTNRVVFLKHLKHVSRTGIAVDLGEDTEGIHCVASAIRDYRNVPIAAVWITGPASRLGARQLPSLGKMVGEIAARISARFGRADG